MEKIIRTLLLAVTITACCATINAQNKDKQRIPREQLAFDDETTAKFVDTYSRCQKEVWSLAPRKKVARGKAKTDAETEEAIEERFDRSQKLLDIRKKYYKEYSKYLTPKQIQRVYSIEKNMMKRLGKNADRRKKNRRQ